MKNTLDKMRHIKHIHFVGIGGAGMGGIAEVLLREGYAISGSDKKEGEMTRRLQQLGAQITFEHVAENIKDADVVVVSTAIDERNPEIEAARAKRIPVVKRALMLAELMRFRHGIAIAGTHGKTTTTSIATSLLTEAGLDPSYVIGGRLNSSGSNAKLGASQYLVVEADESDASFLYLQPMMSIVTNIDADHMSTYQNDFQKLKQTFIDFLHHLPFYGLAVLCIDDPIIREIIPQISRPIITYGFSDDADIQASDFVQEGMSSRFTVQHSPSKQAYSVLLNLAGKHNVLNALASIAIATECGVTPETIQKACAHFGGVGRRMQNLGNIQLNGKTVTVMDDYGHHPRELAATFDALRGAFPDRRVVTVFQPHRYSRTRDLFEDFADVLASTDTLVLLDIYSAGETPIAGIDGRALTGSIRQRKKVDPIFVAENSALVETLEHLVQDDDILLLQGAGDIGAIAEQLIKQFGRVSSV